MNKTITTFTGLKKGQKFKVIANTNGHNYPLDTILTLSKDGNKLSSMSDCAVGITGNNLPARDIVLCNLTIKEMVEEIRKLESKILEFEMRIAFCEESGLEEFDDNTFKVFSALKVINSLSSDIDKSKAIAKLLE